MGMEHGHGAWTWEGVLLLLLVFVKKVNSLPFCTFSVILASLHFFMRRLICLFILASLNAAAADPVRYRHYIFDETEVTTDIKYGQNTTQAGYTKNLTLDLYEPFGDTETNRPLIILAHGGFFLYGSKEQLAVECDSLARAGYVVASINYRLIDVEESEFAYRRAVVDAVSDMKAAVRFFRKDFESGNTYGIDTSNIFIGGFSAGAITSLHYGYASTAEDVFAMGGSLMVKYADSHGGIHGDSGNPGYPNNVRGVINIAGSLHHAGLVDPGEPVLFSVHGTADDIVPYGSGISGESAVTTEGSGLIHARANEVGLINKLVSIEGGDHVSFFFNCAECNQLLLDFLYANLKK
jgi:predicted esterase